MKMFSALLSVLSANILYFILHINNTSSFPKPLNSKEEAEAQKLIEDARMLDEIGCFAIVIEKVPAELATRVAQSVSIPIIGIGAGGGVDGQVLVMHDMLGINKDFSPRFLRRYANLADIMDKAVKDYIEDVKSGDFPNESESY